MCARERVRPRGERGSSSWTMKRTMRRRRRKREEEEEEEKDGKREDKDVGREGGVVRV